jgi:uncharacterized protein YndB with AHSA1/START domain/DNA-binding transcriptional ArsR family regulator
MDTTTDRLDRTFGALADPTRRAILARLAKGEASVTELAEPFEISMPAISKHLKVLERAGLIARGRERQWRPARLEAGPLKDVAEWSERYRRFWEESYDRLDEYLRSSRTEERRRDMGGSGNKLTVKPVGEKEIHMTRVFDAPRDLVFEAHSSCEHMQNWWGPRKYEFASCEIDFRPGGKWRIVHKGPGEEPDQGFHGEYREIVPPERITWTFEWEGMPGHVAVETMTLEEHDGKTTITASSAWDTVEDRDGMLNSGMESGAAESYERLDEYLETLKARAAG